MGEYSKALSQSERSIYTDYKYSSSHSNHANQQNVIISKGRNSFLYPLYVHNLFYNKENMYIFQWDDACRSIAPAHEAQVDLVLYLLMARANDCPSNNKKQTNKGTRSLQILSLIPWFLSSERRFIKIFSKNSTYTYTNKAHLTPYCPLITPPPA